VKANIEKHWFFIGLTNKLGSVPGHHLPFADVQNHRMRGSQLLPQHWRRFLLLIFFVTPSVNDFRNGLI
jgi:hypothetical protein